MCLIRARVDRRIADRGVVGVDESYDFMIIGRAKANGQRATSLGTQVRGVRVAGNRVDSSYTSRTLHV